MSWQSLSATNDTHKNSKLSAKKVIVKNIVISQETTLGNMDISNLEYTRDNYSGNSLTIEETLRAPDISLNRIRALNQEDTSGVVKFVRPIVAPAAALEGLRAYDASFSKTDISYEFNVTRVTKRTGDTIEIQNDASFSNHISAQDVCANVIGSRINGLPIYLSEDVSINEGLECSDISVSHIRPLNAATKLLFHDDISASGAIHAADFSALTFRTKDLSVNDIYGANHHIDVFTDISVNDGIQITEISMNTLGGHNNRLTIHNDLSINGDLMVQDDISLSNLYTTSDLIQFHGVTDISNIIKKLDISVGEIYPKELGNVVYEHIPIKPTFIINGDVSFSGKVHTNWVDSEFNVIDSLQSINDLIQNTSKYEIGTLIQVRNEDNEKSNIFIKTNKESWYKLQGTNLRPFFANFTISYEGMSLNNDILINNNIDNRLFPLSSEYPNISLRYQSYDRENGFQDYDEIIFYVKKINEPDSSYNLKINVFDNEGDPITYVLYRVGSGNDDKFTFENHDFNYLDGAGWGISGELVDNLFNIDIDVPINNGFFDISFRLLIDDNESTINDKIITIKKINEVPVWKHMILEASNYQYIHDEGYDIHDESFNTEEWYSIHNPTYLNYDVIPFILPIDYSNNTQNITDDVSHTFNVRYYNPARFNGDTSYYILDLSSLDPEGFDACYEIHTANNDYLTHDWSWNLDGSKVHIKVPGENNSNPEDLDFSFEIISHDNIVEDVNGFVPTDYYSFNGEDVSKRIVNFHKEIFKPEFNYLSFERGAAVFYTQKNIVDDLSLTDLHFDDNGNAYYDISFHYLSSSPININFNYYDKLAHDVLHDTTEYYNQQQGPDDGRWIVALYDSSCNVTKPNNILQSNTLILQLEGKMSYLNDISSNIYLNIDAFEPVFYISKIDFKFKTKNNNNTYTYSSSTYDANNGINVSTSSTTEIDLSQNIRSIIDYDDSSDDGNDFWLKLEDIVVYVQSNYNTDWYYFSMVNNSTEIFNDNSINSTNTYNVVDNLVNPVLHSVWDDTAPNYNTVPSGPRIKKYTTNLHLQRKQISQLTPSRTSDTFPQSIPITLYTYKFYSTNISNIRFNGYDNKLHFDNILTDEWVRIDNVDGLTGDDQYIEVLYIAGGGNGGMSGGGLIDHDGFWRGENEWATGGGGGAGGNGGYFYIKIDRTKIHGESIIIKFVGDDPAEPQGDSDHLFKIKGLHSTEKTVTFETINDIFKDESFTEVLKKSESLGGGNGGGGASWSGNPEDPTGGGGGGGGISASGQEASPGVPGGDGTGGKMTGGEGGGTFVNGKYVRHLSGQSLDQPPLIVRTEANQSWTGYDYWYDYKTGSGGRGGSAHAHGDVESFGSNKDWSRVAGTEGNNHNAGFYLRFVTDVNS